MEPSGDTSPTSATTFDVPMSRPTINPRSERLDISPLALFVVAARGVAAPADRKTVGVAHVDIRDVVRPLRHELDGGVHERVEALLDLPTAEPHRHAVRQIDLPRTARIQPQRRESHPCLDETPLRREILLRDDVLFSIRPRELSELGWHIARLA